MIFTPSECYRPSGDSEIASLRVVEDKALNSVGDLSVAKGSESVS